jgi:hypothetical protein
VLTLPETTLLSSCQVAGGLAHVVLHSGAPRKKVKSVKKLGGGPEQSFRRTGTIACVQPIRRYARPRQRNRPEFLLCNGNVRIRLRFAVPEQRDYQCILPARDAGRHNDIYLTQPGADNSGENDVAN